MEIKFTHAQAVPNKPTGDRWYNKLQLIVPKGHGLMAGKKVEIISPVYSGVHTIGYLYRGKTVDAIYFDDINFSSNTTGTLKLSTSTAPQPTNPNPGANVNKPTSTTNPVNPVNKTQPNNPGTQEPPVDAEKLAQDIQANILAALGLNDKSEQPTAKASMFGSGSWLTYGIVGLLVIIILMKLLK